MGFSSKTGISLTSGFKYQAQSPLDLRRVVDTITERDELVTINAAWEGMHVYVKADKKTYEYRGGTTWIPVLAGSMYTHPTYTAREAGLYKITVDDTGHISGATAVTKADITGLGIPGSDTKYGVFKAATADAAGGTGLVPAPDKGEQLLFLRGDNVWAKPIDTTYNDVTTSEHGLMTAADKTKLDGIATNANNYTHPTSSGNKHIPSGGSSGDVLRWSADGTAVWGDVPSDAISITRAEYNELLANNTYDPNKYYYVTDDFDSATIINDSASSTSTAYSSSKTNTLLSSKVDKSSKVSVTMNASSWSGSSAPYTITLSINGVTTSNNVEILIPGSATDAQVEAWMAAGIVNGTQDANSVTLKAYGDKPSIDIPIEAIIRND